MPRAIAAARVSLALASSLAAIPAMPGADGAARPAVYIVDSERSEVVIHVGRAGLLKFAGHAHEVLAPRFSGEIVADAGRVEASSVRLAFEAAGLYVSGGGEPPEDVPKVQARMLGPDLLDVVRFPRVTFRSVRVDGQATSVDTYDLRVTGDLSLHGVTRSITLPVRVVASKGALRASGTLSLRQTDYGLTPVSVAGVVKVRDEVAIDFAIAAREAPSGTGQPGNR